VSALSILPLAAVQAVSSTRVVAKDGDADGSERGGEASEAAAKAVLPRTAEPGPQAPHPTDTLGNLLDIHA
jgi:hypothetical protein